jgi:hypothetical protein
MYEASIAYGVIEDTRTANEWGGDHESPSGVDPDRRSYPTNKYVRYNTHQES